MKDCRFVDDFRIKTVILPEVKGTPAPPGVKAPVPVLNLKVWLQYETI
jgi:hypothetical protein